MGLAARALLIISGDPAGAVAAIGETRVAMGELEGSAKKTKGPLDELANGIKMVALASVAVGAVVGAISVKMAADYEQATTRLVTSAGESVAGMKVVGKGMLDMAGQVGYSAMDLAKAMYIVESSGKHGADALIVLRAAAEGAKAENADLAKVADAVTSALQDYHLGADKAAQVTTTLVAAVSQGKTTFEELTGSLHSVLPIASSAHIALADITAAVASMTVHGMSADQATQNLAHTIQHLQTVTIPQGKELAALGLSARQLAADLGTKGLTGTLEEISTAIQTRMGPDGLVVLDLQQALAKLPPEVQKLGAAAAAGTISMGDYAKAAKGLTVEAAGQAQGFATLLKTTHGIGQDQKSGAEIVQTYASALKAATGDSTTLNTALMLTGENAAYTASAVKTVSGATVEADNHVKGWAEIQGTLNQRVDRSRAAVGALAIDLGTQLIPMVNQGLDQFLRFTNFLQQNQAAIGQVGGVLKGLAPIMAGVAAGWMAWNVAMAVTKAMAMGAALIELIGTLAALAAGENLATIATVFFDLAMDANPIGVLVIAIGILVGIIVLLVMHWDQVHGAITRVWNLIKQAGAAVLDFANHHRVLAAVIFALVTGPIGLLIAGIVLLVTHFNQVKAALGSFFSWLGTQAHNVVHTVGQAFSALGSVVHSALMLLVTLAENAWSQFTQRPLYWIGFLLAFIPVRLAMLIAAFLVFAAGLLVAASNWANDMVNKATDMAVRFLLAVVTELYNLPGQVWSLLTFVISHVIAWGRVMIPQALSTARGFLLAVITELYNLPGQVWSLLTQVISRAVAWAADMIPRGAAAARDFGLAVLRELYNLPGQVYTIGVSIAQGIINGIKSMIGAAAGAVGSFVKGIVAGAKAAASISSPSKLTEEEVGVPLAQGVEVGIGRGQPGAVTAMGGLVSSVARTVGGGAALSVGASLGASVSMALAGEGGGGSSSERIERLLQQAVDELHAIRTRRPAVSSMAASMRHA